MKKEILKKFANSSAKAKAKRLYKNITAEEATAALQEEITALETLITEIEGEADDSEKLKAIEETLKQLKEAQTALQEKIAEITAAETETFENGHQRFKNEIKKAVDAGLQASQRISVLRFKNANNANFNVPYYDGEITIEDRPLPSFLEATRQIPMAGETSVVWNEVGSGQNAAAIVAIGQEKPVKTNTTSAATAGCDTLAEIVKLPIQYRNAAPVLQDIFEKDLADDVNEKANSQVKDVIATAANAYAGTPINNGKLWQAIIAAANQVRENRPSANVYVWIANDKSVELDTMTDNNGSPINIDFEAKGIRVRTFVPDAVYTNAKIFAAVEGKIRFYNDGLAIDTSEHAYWSSNQIGLKAEYLNEVIVLRGSDIVNTLYDDISNIIPSTP
jgi:superoxide dismutase